MKSTQKDNGYIPKIDLSGGSMKIPLPKGKK